MPTTVLRRRRAGLCPALFAGSLLLLGLLGFWGGMGALFFPLLSLWANLLLFFCALGILRKAEVRLTRFHWYLLGGVYLAALAYAFIQVNSHTFVYVWDYSNYLLLQYDAEAAFGSGAGVGLWHLYTSLGEDYTSFITLFTEFPFCLTDHTGDSYVLSQMVSVFPTLLLLLGGLVVKTGQLIGVKNESGYFLVGLTLTVVFPYLRMAAALGQPDWFGLIFAFMILLLTLDYRFDRLEPGRCAAIFFATEALILTRRWYLYFLVGYFFTYAVLVVLSCRGLPRRARNRRLRNLVLFGAGSAAAMCLLLWPIVRHILLYNYSSHYAVYNTGGLALELYSQFFRLSPLYLFLMGWGLWAARKKKQAFLPALALGQLAVSLVLFTRVQNMGSHQILLLIPGYFLLMLEGAAALADSLNRRRALKLGFWAFTVLFYLSVRLSPLTTIALPGFILDSLDMEFTRLDAMIYDRTDLAQIRQLADWIDQNCAEGEFAYMIPHSLPYNPDLFLNCDLPNRPLENKLCFGFGILGTQPFPTELFEAKYVLTALPFPWCFEVSNVSETLDTQFWAMQEQYFTYETSFDMGNGTVFYVYRRTTPTDLNEVQRYLDAFAEEDALFPELYSEVIWGWCAENGLI